MKKSLSMLLICCIISTLLCMNPGGYPVFAQDNFTFTKTSADLTEYSGITYGKGVYIVTGAGGSLLSSQDAKTWTKLNSNSVFSAVGENGVMIYSKDGIFWRACSKICPYRLSGIAVKDNQFFVTGTMGVVLTSIDGIDWSSKSIGTSEWMRGIVWGNEKLAAVGSCGRMFTSFDGEAWEDVSQGTAENLYSAAWVCNRYMVNTGVGKMLTSVDGQLWSERKTGISDGKLDCIAWNGRLFVAEGNRYEILEDNSICTTGAIYTSQDGNTWTKRLDLDRKNCFVGVVYNGKYFVAVSDKGEVYTSEDGLNWAETRINTNNVSLTELVWEGNQFLVLAANDGKIFISLDGHNWNEKPLPYGFRITSICYTGSTYVGVGDNGLVATSIDGSTWTKQISGVSGVRLNSVVWTGGQVIAVGDGGTILASPDGFEWISIPSGTSMKLYRVIWDGNRLLAVGELGTILKGIKTGPSFTPAPVSAIITRPDNENPLYLTTTTTIPVEVSIKVTGKTIRKVEFYCNDQLLGSSEISPYLYSWEYIVKEGWRTEVLKAKVICTDGTSYESKPKEIKIFVPYLHVSEIRSNISGYIQPDFLSKDEESSSVKQGFRVKIGDKSAVTDSNGYFSIHEVSYRHYSSLTPQYAKITKPNYLERNITFTATENVHIGSKDAPLEMWAGDMCISGTQDGAINMADIMEIARYFNSVSGDSRYDAETDLNQDSAINMADIMIAAKHFNAVSEDYYKDY